MGWRTVRIGNPATLRYKNRALLIIQNGDEVSVPLEDIAVIILDSLQMQLTSQLLSHCGREGIALLVIGETHLPNGLLLPFLSHSRALQVMRRQLALTLPKKKRLWQQIVRRKLANQAAVLTLHGHGEAAKRLHSLVRAVRSGDIDNCEATGAQLYFRALLGGDFHRKQERFVNAAMNYGYSIVRSAIARSLVAYGFQPSFGLHHHNEQNAFNLADDLIEPFRPLVDLQVCKLLESGEEPQVLTPNHKNSLTTLLQENVILESEEGTEGAAALLAAVDMIVQSLGRCVRNNGGQLSLPVMNCEENE